MNKNLEEYKNAKKLIEEQGMTHHPYYQTICEEVMLLEAENYHDFMMRGDRGIVLALFDKMGIKLAPEELRGFRVDGDPLPADFLKGASDAMDDVRKGNRSPYIRKSSRKGS